MPITANNAWVSSVASSATNVTLFQASGSLVIGRMVFNDSTAILYLKFGAGASTSSYTVQIAPNGGYFEFPGNNIYNGQVDGIWASANGFARVTSW